MSRGAVLVGRALKLCGLAVLTVSCACASTPRSGAVHRPAQQPETFAEHEARVLAAQENARAVVAEGEHSEGILRSVQLRAGTQGSFDDGDGPQGSVRLSLDQPLRTRELSRSKQAAGDAAQLKAEAEGTRAMASTCEESVQARAHAPRQAYSSSYRTQLSALLERTRAFSAAGTIDPVNGARAELQLSRRLLETRPLAPGLRAHPTLGPLPEPAEPGQPLDTNSERLNARIEQKHPEVRSHLATASEHQHAALSEKRSRIPYIDFVQLDMATGEGAPNLGGRLALEIPLDTGARGRAERHAHLSLGETYEAMGIAAELSQLASAALAELVGFEGDGPQQKAILEQAERADALASRFLASQDETPDRIAQLLAEAHAARLSVLEARERAGKAACLLEYATGTSYAAWPRAGVREAPAQP